MNPLAPNQNSGPTNNIDGMIDILKNGPNPMSVAQMAAQKAVQNNPNLPVLLNGLQNQCTGGRTPKDVVLDYCQSQGVPNDLVMRLAQTLGLN